jgi:hypothetical protein
VTGFRDVGQWLGRLLWEQDIFGGSSPSVPTAQELYLLVGTSGRRVSGTAREVHRTGSLPCNPP